MKCPATSREESPRNQKNAVFIWRLLECFPNGISSAKLREMGYNVGEMV